MKSADFAAMCARVGGMHYLNFDSPKKLAGGLFAPFYVNARGIGANPVAFREVVNWGARLVGGCKGHTPIIVSVQSGFNQFGGAIALWTETSHIIVHAKEKSHGAQVQIDGLDVLSGGVKGRCVIVGEDTCTSGDTLVRAIAILREHEAVVTDCMVICANDKDALCARLAALGVVCHIRMSMEEYFSALLREGTINGEEYDALKAWRADPPAWHHEYVRKTSGQQVLGFLASSGQ